MKSYMPDGSEPIEPVTAKHETTCNEKFDFFKEALSHCGTFLLDLSDEDIEYHVFEEFDGDCTSFLHANNLNLLQQSGKITMEIVDMALELSSKFRAFENTKLWNVQSVKSSEEWLEVLELSDYIKKELKVNVT